MTDFSTSGSTADAVALLLLGPLFVHFAAISGRSLWRRRGFCWPLRAVFRPAGTCGLVLPPGCVFRPPRNQESAV
jgi:hypothetical protein